MKKSGTVTDTTKVMAKAIATSLSFLPLTYPTITPTAIPNPINTENTNISLALIALRQNLVNPSPVADTDTPNC